MAAARSIAAGGTAGAWRWSRPVACGVLTAPATRSKARCGPRSAGHEVCPRSRPRRRGAAAPARRAERGEHRSCACAAGLAPGLPPRCQHLTQRGARAGAGARHPATRPAATFRRRRRLLLSTHPPTPTPTAAAAPTADSRSHQHHPLAGPLLPLCPALAGGAQPPVVGAGPGRSAHQGVPPAGGEGGAAEVCVWVRKMLGGNGGVGWGG